MVVHFVTILWLFLANMDILSSVGMPWAFTKFYLVSLFIGIALQTTEKRKNRKRKINVHKSEFTFECLTLLMGNRALEILCEQ